MAELHGPLQLSLGVSLVDEANFSTFYCEHDAQRQVLAQLQAVAEGRGQHNVFIWGDKSAGLSHLLQALCHAAFAAQRSAQYLPLRDLAACDPQALTEGLEHCELVCLDDIETVCANPAWEQAIFHLHNRLRDLRHSLVLASHPSPASLPVQLPDLKSRLCGATIFHLPALGDEGLQSALIERARHRGMEMPTEVAAFILKRCTRNMHALMACLDRIDQSSLQAQRKLSVPFVKSVLEL